MRGLAIATRRHAALLALLPLLGPMADAGVAHAQIRLPGAASAKNGETDAGADETAAPTPAALAAEHATITATLESLRAAVQRGETDAATLERLALYERLDRTLTAHEEAFARLGEIESADASGQSPIGAAPPYPFALYEATGQALDNQRQQVRLLEERVKAQRAETERLAAKLAEVERERRRVKEKLESSGPLEAARQKEALARLEVESRLAQAELERSRTEAQLGAAEAEVQARQVELLAATEREVRSRVSITRFDLDEPLNRIALAEQKLRAQADKARTQLETAERRLADAQRRSDLVASPSPELRAELEARRLQRRAAQAGITTAETQLDRLALERLVWERRVDALGDAPRDELARWASEIENELDRLRRAERLEATQSAELTETRTRLQAALEKAEGPEKAWLAEQLQAVEALASLQSAAMADAAATRAFLARALRDFQPEAGPRSPMDRLRTFLARADDFWDREVFVVDDRSITVGKLLLASVLFVLAFSLSRFFSSLAGRLLYRRLLEPGAALAFQSLTFYGLLVAFLLVALRTVNIPLTAFALLGGALAIGIGFGSQNVISNFISGLILLVERPIKVGDVVDVEGVAGIIDRVGPRSTQIRTFDNLHIIVPNSMLLEQKVVNWTLSDDTLRRKIVVGVSYDAPVREVAKLILRAIDEHGRVLKKPEPKAHFQDFGDNALVFHAFFWVQLDSRVSFLEIESDLRHRIFHLFRDAGISIAFPQRDVHLDAPRPIEVRMLPPSDGEPPA